MTDRTDGLLWIQVPSLRSAHQEARSEGNIPHPQVSRRERFILESPVSSLMTTDWEWTEEQIEGAYEILKDSTRENPVTSETIRKALSIKDFSGRWRSRDLITEMMRRTGLPLASGNGGYFVMRTSDDLKVYRSQLRVRSLHIQGRIDLIERNWERMYGQPPPEEEDSEDEDDSD